jgi:hypothetical protein
MRHRAILLATLFAASMCATQVVADASNWTAVTSTDSTFMEYVDTNSLSIRYGQLTALFLKNYDDPQIDGPKSYQSIKVLRMFDCSRQRVGSLTVSRFAERDARGEVVYSKSQAPEQVTLDKMPPESIGAAEIDYVCSLWSKRALLPFNRTLIPR